MARDGVAVRAEVASAVAAYVGPDGARMNVAATCRRLGITRQTFYKYVTRYQAVGVEGFFPDSRRPRSSPAGVPVELEDVLLRIRKEEAERGWDYGADAVLMRLEEQVAAGEVSWPPGRGLPSRSTINRVFDARGVLAKTPQRAPRRRYRRFAREEVNALWQYDGFDAALSGGRRSRVLHLSDDCSRVDLALQAATSENGPDVWATFCLAVERYGLPAQVLTDNGHAFSGKRRGWASAFERALADLDVQAICSAVAHPQTCGKNERAHQRVLKWLTRQPLPTTLVELQGLLDTYRATYNDRRSQVLAGLTPHERFRLGPTARPDGVTARTHVARYRVSSRGAIGVDATLIGLGRPHAGKTATVFRTNDHLVVFIDNQLVRELVLDRSRRYQRRDQ
jgi:transposase InsO family protein